MPSSPKPAGDRRSTPGGVGPLRFAPGCFAKTHAERGLFLGDAGSSRARVWQENDPTQVGETTFGTPSGLSWNFETRPRAGTLWLDAYFEGTPYSASTTRYAATTTYDTVASNSIADIVSLGTWDDLRVYKVRTTSVEQRLYDGAAQWDGTKTTYTYDNYLNVTEETESGCPAGTCSAYRKSTTDYAYTDDGTTYRVDRPSRQQVKNGGGTTVLADSLSFYDSKGNLTTQRTWVDGPLDTGRYSQVSYGYDGYGNQTAVTTYSAYGTSASAPTSGGRTTYTCHGGGGMINGTACDDDGYHSYPLWTKNALGQVTELTCNYSKGAPASETDPNGVIMSATYDAFGRITGVTRSDDSTYQIAMQYHDGSGFWTQIDQTVDAGNTFSVQRYTDGLGRQITVKTGHLVSGNFFLDNTVSYDYPDALTTRQSMPYGPNDTNHNTAATAFYMKSVSDKFGRPVTVIAPDDTSTDYSYDGLTTTVTDANNHSTVTTNDVWGRTVNVTPPTGPGVTYTYDALGHLIKAVRGWATTKMEYDNAGRKVGMDDPDMGSAGTLTDDDWAWDYTYDALGNLKTQTDARGCLLQIDYDSLNRLTHKYSSGSGCGSQVDTHFTYDQGTNSLGQTQKGLRTGMTDISGGSSAWQYDSRGNLLREDKVISGTTYTTRRAYNQASLPTAMTYPGGEVVSYGYNPLMQLETVTGTNPYVNNIDYDSAGRMTGRVLGNNTITSSYTQFAWNAADGAGRLLSANHSGSVGLQAMSYTYDAVGNVKTITDNLATPHEVQTFNYDALDRLTDATVTNGPAPYSETYSYNGTTGTLATKAGNTYTYGDPAHAHAVTSMAGNSYGYDPNGNMIERVIGGQTYTLGYDAEGHLVSGTGPNNFSASFVYDGDGARVMSTINGTVTTFVGNYYEKTGSTVTKYYFAGGDRVAMRTGSTLNYLVSDHLGSTSLVTNASGGLIAETRYKPFGEVRYTTPDQTLPTRYTFTGQYSYVADEATDLGTSGFGLLFFKARFYDPGISKFVQPDTLIPEASQGTQAWDRYAFVNNNPVRYKDPSGHFIVDALSWLGILPDFRGIATAMLFTGNKDAVVMAGIAVQSEWFGPQDIPAVMSVYDRVTGTDPNSHGYGFAQVGNQQMVQYGLEGENQMYPSVAADAMEARINQAMSGCSQCQSGVDRLIVAALAQNGLGPENFEDLPLSNGTIDWDRVLSESGAGSSALSAQIRQGATGLNYSTEFMLKLYVQDLRVLVALGYDLPEGITEDDLDYVNQNYVGQ